MPTKFIQRSTAPIGQGFGASSIPPNVAAVYVDADTNVFGFNSNGTARNLVDDANAQAIAGAKTFTSSITPTTTDGAALGSASVMWSDLFLASGAVINFNNGDVTITHASNDLTIAGGTLSPGEGLDFNGLSPAASPISLTGVTLASNTNAIRGVNIAPNRVSGWTCFTGTTAMSAYMDYREMHTADASLIYGSGFFPFMDSGASCASMSAVQAICEADAGATVTTASGAQGTGIYALWGKTLINSATVNSGAQIAAAWLSVQANVTDISGRASAIIHAEVASGALRDLIHFNATGGVLATNLFNFSAAVSPLTTGGAGTPTAASGDWYNLRCSINGTAAYIPISTAAWTNA